MASGRGNIVLLLFLLTACSKFEIVSQAYKSTTYTVPVASSETTARSITGQYISWKEHIIDDENLSGVPLRGSDGLTMADLDDDGFQDIVSVHESDTEYDGIADGHIRIAFGTPDPERWELVTLAEGSEAGAPEDVAVGDINGDGHPDVIAACELAHLIYFENPGLNARSAYWRRLIPEAANNRGSFIRVFLADLDDDGRPEIITANKGSQDPAAGPLQPKPLSWFEIDGMPLDDDSWIEHELTRVLWPINAQPVDLDGDGDLDIVGGSVAENRIMWFENVHSVNGAEFIEHDVQINGTSLTGDKRPPGRHDDNRAMVNGFNMDFKDLNDDGRLDIILFETSRLVGETLVWLEQPSNPENEWLLHFIGDYAPDALVGLAAADINNDGYMDVMTGGYSFGSRASETDVTVNDRLGRLAWFENPGTTGGNWIRHDVSRRKRGMYDKFIPIDMDHDGDMDFVSTRGNSGIYDGVFWLEQVRTDHPVKVFDQAREKDSMEMPLPR